MKKPPLNKCTNSSSVQFIISNRKSLFLLREMGIFYKKEQYINQQKRGKYLKIEIREEEFLCKFCLKGRGITWIDV